MSKLVTIEGVRETLIQRLRDYLPEAEAIGILGSLARGKFDQKESDIDVFVVLNEIVAETHNIWWKRVREALSDYDRDVTVLVYSIKGLKSVSNWYVLRLAAEGVTFYDRGGVGNLFAKIVEAAHRAGLVEGETEEGRKTWTVGKPLEWGGVIEVVVEN